MITEHDLQEAIAECEGQRNPNANTCVKLAAFYIIKDHMYPQGAEPQGNGYADADNTMYSYALGKGADADGEITYASDTEFSDLIQGKTQAEVMPIIDELMTALQVVNPRLYASAMRKLEG